MEIPFCSRLKPGHLRSTHLIYPLCVYHRVFSCIVNNDTNVSLALFGSRQGPNFINRDFSKRRFDNMRCSKSTGGTLVLEMVSWQISDDLQYFRTSTGKSFLATEKTSH